MECCSDQTPVTDTDSSAASTSAASMHGWDDLSAAGLTGWDDELLSDPPQAPQVAQASTACELPLVSANDSAKRKRGRPAGTSGDGFLRQRAWRATVEQTFVFVPNLSKYEAG